MLYPKNKLSGAGESAIFEAETKSSLPDINLALKNTPDITPQSIFIVGLSVSATLNFPSTLGQASSDRTIPCMGAQIGDIVMPGGAIPLPNTCYTGHVATANVVTIRLNNYSTDILDPASGIFTAIVIPSGL